MLKKALLEYIPDLTQTTIRGFLIFIIALGIVYIVGRMLEILKTPRSKNFIAIISMILLSYWSIHIYEIQELIHPWEIYFRTLLYVSISSIFYVLIGFDLFDRFNAWCDKKIGKKRK